MHTSYAQNSEDIILWRALNMIKNGFYIDVGANDPDTDSVTRHFYEHGWNGINIEPLLHWNKILNEKRPKDINLRIAAGSAPGQLEIYELTDTRLSTSDKAIAERHEQTLGYKKKSQIVDVEKIANICIKYKVKEIHFLKIDVEGAEEDVLKGCELLITKPWVILIESTLPFTSVESHHEWEHYLIEAGYKYVYFDGLNRFYISPEHTDIESKVKVPPNIGDGFITYSQRNAEQKAIDLQNKINGIYSSLSWKITAPLRYIDNVFRNNPV